MIDVYKNGKVFKFLHVPVQSGNDEILKLMKRNYKVDDFKKIITEFRKNIPNLTISTDIICGFPTETEQQFNDSLELIKEIKPDVLNISRFQARPGTEAFKMEGQIEGGVTKNRSRLLTDIFTNISRMNNEKWLNWKGGILIDEKGKHDTWVGRNLAYKPVIVRGEVKIGDNVKVIIKNITPYDLRGEIV
jgi:tRNA A37 methylthiotransferase MiaB